MQHLFELDEDFIHLNHAAVGPWPITTRKAIDDFAHQNMRRGSTNYLQWMDTEQRLRERMARLINSPSVNDIALMKSTSEALSTVAFGVNWQAGDRILTLREEFPSNRIVWDALKPRFAVELDYLSIHEHEELETAIINGITKHTRMVAVSAVQYSNGLRLDLKRIGQACKAKGCLFLVDAIQMIGALPFDVQDIQADFVAADGHKWMCGPEGVALFYCRAEMRPTLTLNQIGWHMVEHMGDYDSLEWTPANSARRFECGSPNMLGIHGLEASLAMLESLGMDNIATLLIERMNYLIEQLPDSYQILTPTAPEKRAGILTIKPSIAGTESVFKGLQNAQVLCAPRGGGIRLSPHFHTPLSQLDTVCELLHNLDR